MTCREVVDFLTEYGSGKLPAAERAAFEEHLAACPPCVAYLKSYEEAVKLGKAVTSNPDDCVPDAVPEELVQAILAARAKRS